MKKYIYLKFDVDMGDYFLPVVVTGVRSFEFSKVNPWFVIYFVNRLPTYVENVVPASVSAFVTDMDFHDREIFKTIFK